MLKSILKKNKLSERDQYLRELLQRKICKLSPDGDYLTNAESHSGIGILGSSGSGKTSGIAAVLLDGILEDKERGGSLLTVKSDESAQLIQRIKKAGRLDDLIHFHDGSPYTYNFIEATRRGGSTDINLLTEAFLEAYRQMRNFKSLTANTDSSDPFWDDMREILLSILISTLLLAGQEISIRNIRRLLSHNFSPEDVQRYSELIAGMNNPRLPKAQTEELWKEFAGWLQQNYLLFCLEKARDRAGDFNAEDKDALADIEQYWMYDWPDLAHETRSSIKGSMMALLKPFTNTGILKRHFSGGLSPELLFEQTYTQGKIILIDFPSATHGVPGAIATALMKYAFQQTIKRRNIQEEERPKACFLYCDEIQAVLSPKTDEQFQGIARSNMVTTIYITQSINSIAAAMGSNMAETRAKSLMNNLGLKCFCANSDNTNDYASKLIGKSLQQVASTRMGKDKEVVHSYNQQLLPQVPDDHFTRLRTGGAENSYEVDCILFKTGKQWKSGKNYLEATFTQSF